MAACSSSYEEEPRGAVSDEIMIEVGVNQTFTRAGYTSANLDKVQLIIRNTVNSEYSYNTVCSKVGMSWMPGGKMLWDQARTPVTIAAIAPVRSNVSDLTTLDVTVPSFYSTENDLKNADLLVMTKRVDPKTDLTSDSKLAIQLNHTLAKLTIDFGSRSVSNVKVEGTILSGTCNLRQENAAVVVSDDASSAITPLKNNDGTYECLIIPQTAESLTVTFRSGDRKYRWTASTPTKFEAGTTYPLSVQ